MSRKSKIAVATILILAIAGCASEETPQATNPAPPPPALGTPPKTESSVAKPPSKTQSFKDPLVADKKKPPTVNSASTNLIQLTNPTERAILVTKGRKDPFDQIIGQTVPQMPTNTTVRQVPKLPPLPTATIRDVLKTARKQPTRTTVVARNTTVKIQKPKLNPPVIAQVLPKVLPQVVPNPTLVSVLPPPAQPEIARAAFVSGVVLIGKEPQAIIKMPNEQTSRYVQTGQRLANGVLIKRIEMNEGSNPVVILEQYGIEVAKMVGEAPAASTPSGTTPAGSPVSLTTPTASPVIVGAL